MTADLQEAERLLGADRQAAVLNRADARIANDVPILPLFQHPIWAGLAGQVRGYVPYGNSGLTGAENWWLDR